jgi:hypothetical protein
VNPAGICDDPPPGTAIAAPSFFRAPSPSCFPAPLGPNREKKKGGAAPPASPAAAVVAAIAIAPSSCPLRPPTLSVSRPSPMT